MTARKAPPRRVPAPVLGLAEEPRLDLPGEDWTPLPHLSVPSGIRVVLHKRVRGPEGTETAEEEVDWPAGWPLPQQGTVVLGERLSGWVQHVEMDVVNRRVIVMVRQQ